MKRTTAVIVKYTWLFPLLISLVGVFYYINWFERLFKENPQAYHTEIYTELQISICVLLLITSLLNWALVGFWRHLHTRSCNMKVEKKHDRK